MESPTPLFRHDPYKNNTPTNITCTAVPACESCSVSLGRWKSWNTCRSPPACSRRCHRCADVGEPVACTTDNTVDPSNFQLDIVRTDRPKVAKSLPVDGVEGLLTFLFGANERFLFGVHPFVDLQTVRRQKRFAAVGYVALEPVFACESIVKWAELGKDNQKIVKFRWDNFSKILSR